jgi:hypothetical protein
VIPVDQTTFGVPGGNCFSACVASLLELPIGAVPYFMHHGDGWWDAFLAWLAPRGLDALCFELPASGDAAVWYPRGFHVLSGKSPRGDHTHSVVARGRDVVHDPHPDRTGVETRHDVVVLVPLDLGAWTRKVVAP